MGRVGGDGRGERWGREEGGEGECGGREKVRGKGGRGRQGWG